MLCGEMKGLTLLVLSILNIYTFTQFCDLYRISRYNVKPRLLIIFGTVFYLVLVTAYWAYKFYYFYGMQNTAYPNLDYFLKKLPITNMFFLTPIIVFSFIKSFEDLIIVLIIFSITSMSIMATVYGIMVTDYKKNIDPKKFLVLSVITAVLLFVSMYFGFTALGWMDM